MAKNYEGGVQSPESYDNSTLWNARPPIEGFTPDELEQLYSADSAMALEQIKQMPGQERDAKILEILPKLGHVSLFLIDQIEALADDPQNHEHTKKCLRSLQNLNIFEDQLLELYRGQNAETSKK